MKTFLQLTACIVLVAQAAYCQGTFIFNNITAPTRIGAIDGALAGPGYWAQMLAGPDAGFLQPVGLPAEHFSSGVADGGSVMVPDAPCGSSVYVQMVAWDGALWGTSLSSVPPEQLGRTDIVPIRLTCLPLPFQAPAFMEPAIVPIPEPSVTALGVLSASVFLVCRWFGRQHERS